MAASLAVAVGLLHADMCHGVFVMWAGMLNDLPIFVPQKSSTHLLLVQTAVLMSQLVGCSRAALGSGGDLDNRQLDHTCVVCVWSRICSLQQSWQSNGCALTLFGWTHNPVMSYVVGGWGWVLV